MWLIWKNAFFPASHRRVARSHTCRAAFRRTRFDRARRAVLHTRDAPLSVVCGFWTGLVLRLLLPLLERFPPVRKKIEKLRRLWDARSFFLRAGRRLQQAKLHRLGGMRSIRRYQRIDCGASWYSDEAAASSRRPLTAEPRRPPRRRSCRLSYPSAAAANRPCA